MWIAGAVSFAACSASCHVHLLLRRATLADLSSSDPIFVASVRVADAKFHRLGSAAKFSLHGPCESAFDVHNMYID